MGSSSKVLMELEGKDKSSTASYLGSKLFFTAKTSVNVHSDSVGEKPSIVPVPKSQVLGKVKDFLGVISESNKNLLRDAKGNSDDRDIEVLTGKESHIIELDLMLGIADLHTPEAVAAAEAVMAGYQSVISAGASSSSESEDEENNDGNDDSTDENGNTSSRSNGKGFSRKLSKSQRSRKRSKIVELC
ncbi:hypothetical protein F511_35970 [Dorcoceras hygrometricum]|uniref:Uncharacterized protein n=1 Tax=Dorcoceras hygrometricum TaxID=472368 RepID=A0A2Z7BI34_9LAMI|nr:hypothetical protein F511_35970 [Dorcoceras hygrometricum]